MGCEVVAVDLNAMMIERAKENAESARADVDFRVADVQKLPFKDSMFDAVIGESVLVFVPDRAKAMGELARVAKEGGFVGINEIYWRRQPPDDIRAKVMELYDLREDVPSLEGWKALLGTAGLKPIDAEPHSLVDRRALSRMKRLDILQALRIMWRAIYGYMRYSGFRSYMNYLAMLPKSFPDYLGYCILVGKR
jgi:SAM-dependent methyltransferase